MKQEITADPNEPRLWELDASGPCFAHLCKALVWLEITGANPPHPPVTAKEYKRHELPWYAFHRDDVAALEGSDKPEGAKKVS